jgi:hypothetical protein
MYGKKARRIAHLERLSSSRGERLTEVTRYADTLIEQHRRHIARQDALVQIIAVHLTSGTNREQLRAAMERAGFRAELEYALLDLAPNDKPATAAKGATA